MFRASRFAAAFVAMFALAACGPGDKKKAAAHVKVGADLAAQGKHGDAIVEFRKAADLNRDSLDARLGMGDSFRALKKYDDAFAAYDAAKKVDRASPKPYLAAAHARLDRGEIDKAIADADQATEVDPGNIEGMILQGRVSMMARKLPDGSTGVPQVSLDRARLNLEAAVQKAPDSVAARYWLARLYEILKMPEPALAAWTKAGELAADKPEHAKIAPEIAEAISRLKR
jgi:tetratricopeptide (TPR) repeat protein